MEFHIKKYRFSVKSRFKELECVDRGHSLNRDFAVQWFYMQLVFVFRADERKYIRRRRLQRRIRRLKSAECHPRKLQTRQRFFAGTITF